MIIKVGDIIKVKNVYDVGLFREFDGKIIIVKKSNEGMPKLRQVTMVNGEYSKLIRTKILEMLVYDYKGY